MPETTIELLENVPTKLTSDTAFGPAFLTVNFTEVFAPVVEEAGAWEETEISAGVLLRSSMTELRAMYTPLSVRNARPSLPQRTKDEGLLETLLSTPTHPKRSQRHEGI